MMRAVRIKNLKGLERLDWGEVEVASASSQRVAVLRRRADRERPVPVPGGAVHLPGHGVPRHRHLLRQRPQRRRPQRAAVHQDHGVGQVEAAGVASSPVRPHISRSPLMMPLQLAPPTRPPACVPYEVAVYFYMCVTKRVRTSSTLQQTKSLGGRNPI